MSKQTRTSALLRWSAALSGILLAIGSGTYAAQAATPIITAVTDPPTVVSLTFDDGNADQEAGVSILDAAGMKGTFFITTGWVDAASYFTRAQLTALKAGGHEIAGHSVSHPDLATIPIDEVTKQICQGRNTLADWGFPTTDFAYPFASLNPAVEAAVQTCGFNSARSLGDIATRFGGTDVAETIPPADPFQTRALDEVDSTWTLADLQGAVTNAEAAGGGWVQYTFHHVCATACDPLNLTITPTLLQQFVTWLAARAPTAVGSTTNTVVETVQQVVGGAVKPLVASTNSFRPAPAAGVNGVLNPSLETAGPAGQPPQCWQEAGFGISTRTFSTVPTAHTGSAAEQLVVTALVSGDAKLALTQDLGTCAPTATPGNTYSLRAWYTSTVTTQFDVYYRNSVGGWIYWTSSPFFAAASTYTQAEWTTPPVPAGSTGISFGLNLISNGTLVTDDYALYDTVGAPPVLQDLTTTTPTITGTARVGQVLTAVPGAWGPGTVVLTYQWLRAGVAIAGATSATYTPVTADIGAALSVSVTGTETGFTTVTKTSAATLPVLSDVITTSRLAGADRFATSVAISQAFVPGVARVYVANGGGFADALSASPAAAHFSSPLLLTQQDSVPASVRAEIVRLAPAKIVVVGGTAVVSDAVLAQLNTIAPAVRIAGPDRYSTSRAIATDAFGTSAATAYIATGINFPDALSAGPASAHFAGPVILVPGTSGSLDAATSALLASLHVTQVRIAGGPAAVSSGIENALRATYSVTRNSGVDRYATGVAINADAFATGTTVYLAVGTNFADALAGGALAGWKNAPLYVTQPTCVPQSVLDAIKRLNPINVVLFGGPAALSDNVLALGACN